jgi:DNA-binding beta-propeller fold protein YncE
VVARAIALLAAAAIPLAGCGAGEEAGVPPAAEPAESPPLSRQPAGEVVAELGSLAEGLAIDPRTRLAAAITREPVGLALVDLASGRVARRVRLPGVGRHLELARAGGPVLVPVEGSDELIAVPLPDGPPRAVKVGDFPHDAAVAAGRVFVGDEMGDTLTVIERGEAIETLPAPEQPGGIVAAGPYVAAVAVAERVLRVYDARSLEPVSELALDGGPTHAVAAGRTAFVADTGGDAILSIRLGPEPELLGTTAVPGTPYGLAIDPRRQRLWATLTARNEAVEYSIAGGTLEELARHPTVRQPNTIAVDPRSGDALVAGKTARGPLQRIEGS